MQRCEASNVPSQHPGNGGVAFPTEPHKRVYPFGDHSFLRSYQTTMLIVCLALLDAVVRQSALEHSFSSPQVVSI